MKSIVIIKRFASLVNFSDWFADEVCPCPREYRTSAHQICPRLCEYLRRSVSPRGDGNFLGCHGCSLSWNVLSEKYPVVEFDPPTPLVRDPVNPGVNVAESLPYWGQLRAEYASWLRSLGIAVSPLGS